MTRPESFYPLRSRMAEIRQIMFFAKQGRPCQLISVPGAGRSTALRLIAFNKELREFHLGDREQNFLFVYVNMAEQASFDPFDLIRFLFINMIVSIEENRPDSQDLHNIFRSTAQIADPMAFFQVLKTSITKLVEKNITPVFLLDRFSEYVQKTDDNFFIALHSLQIASGSKLGIVFSCHKPLEQLLKENDWKNFSKYFLGNHIFVELAEREATEFRLDMLEKSRTKEIPYALRERIFEVTGGHSKTTRLAAEMILEETQPLPNTKEDLVNYLLSSMHIKTSLMEIWQSLTHEEKQLLKDKQTDSLLIKLQLPFPIFSDFIYQQIPDMLVPKEIRLDKATNQIFFGDQPLTDLTAQEFKLLNYLVANPNRVCEREEVINAVWMDAKTREGVSDEALDQMIYRLRRKVEDEPDNPRHLTTVKGRGFRFIP